MESKPPAHLGRRLVGELIVVFMGVSAAVFVDNYREEQQMTRRARLLTQALHEDISTFGEDAARYVAAIREGLAEWSRQNEAGRRPAPFVLRVPGAEAPPSDVWQVAMQSGAGDVLDPQVVIELSRFYNEIAGETTKYQRYTAFTEQRVWPLLAAGDTAAFYDSRTGKLKPEFLTHRWQLEELATDLEAQGSWARSLAAKLAPASPPAGNSSSR
jgi:hypothetical protein